MDWLDLAGFPAVRAVVLPVGAEPDSMLALAKPAVLLASALLLGEVALHANDRLVQANFLFLQYMTGVPRRQAATGRVVLSQQRPRCLDTFRHAC